MNEKENNAVELKDPQLEKVSGGNGGSGDPCPKLSIERDFTTCTLMQKGTLSDCAKCELSAGKQQSSPGCKPYP